MEPPPTFVEDLHICGLCRAQFNDVDFFIEHKKNRCPRLRLLREGDQIDHSGDNHSRHVPQPFHSTESQLVNPVHQDSSTGGYLQKAVTSSQLGSQNNQSDSVEVENDGHIGSSSHKYVLLSSPNAEELFVKQGTRVDFPLQPISQVQEPAYTLDSQGIPQTNPHTVNIQDLTRAVPKKIGKGNQSYGDVILLSSPNTVEVMQQIGNESSNFMNEDDNLETVRQLQNVTGCVGLPLSDANRMVGTQSQSDHIQHIFDASESLQMNENGHGFMQKAEHGPCLRRLLTGSGSLQLHGNIADSMVSKSETGQTLTGSGPMQISNSLPIYNNAESVIQSTIGTILAGATNTNDSQASVQDGFVTSSDQEQQIHYTLSLNTPSDSLDNQRMPVRPGNPVPEGFSTPNIQYTLSSEEQDRAVRDALDDSGTDVDGSSGQKSKTSENGKLEHSYHYNVKPSRKKQTQTSPGKKVKPVLEKKYLCNYKDCPYKTAYLKDLERHHRIHTGEKPFKCGKCGKSFNRNDKLMIHHRYHLNDRTFKCPYTDCEYSAVENGSLKKHLKVHEDERPFSCQVCPYKSRSASQLQIHLRTHTGDTPYSCKVCKAVFKVSSDLIRHLRVHTGEKPFACEYDGCNYKCSIKSNLRSHYNSNHKPEQELTCDQCDFKTSGKKALFEHQKSHDVNKDLMCPTCKYQCSNKSALKNHVRMHNTEDRFKCNYCSYSSVQSGNLQSHMRRKHPSKALPKGRKTKLSVIPLRKCGWAEETKPVKKSATVKTKCPQNFKCDQCPAAFVREDSLKCHLKQHSESSLSTAYAVLNLQNPVINAPTPSSASQDMPSVPRDTTPMTAQPNCPTININDTLPSANQPECQKQEEVLPQEAGFQSPSQGAVFQGLGISDILMAAGMSGMNSAGNSPTFRASTEQTNFQELLPSETGAISVSSILSASQVGQDCVQNVTVGQSPQDVPSMQVMQNISLPYIRLPNGQVLILTGQNPLGQLVPQSEANSSTDVQLTAPIQTQIFAQQPTTEQQQIIQAPADSSCSEIPAPQQPGAIPIQIILPNGSQRAVPLVSQLLNTVMNRVPGDGASLAPVDQSQPLSQVDSKQGLNEAQQNFLVRIPAQAGASKDGAENSTESQSFVLQIPGMGNFT